MYFLLAAVGAGIALALNQTQGLALTWSQVPLALAILFWALSFYFGCRHLSYVESTLYANASLLKVEAGDHPEVGRNPQVMAAASEGIRAAIQSNSNWASRLARWQFRCLVLGAISYIGWHVYEMFLRSPQLSGGA